MGPALRLSCRSELHVLPRFPVAQTIRSPDYDELSGPHRCFQSGPACYGFVCHPGISPLSRYGIQLALVLPSVLPVTSCMNRRVGFTDLSRLLERCCHRPGQCYLPDKEFRLNSFPRSFHGLRKNDTSPYSVIPACRHADRTISSTAEVQALRQCLACSL